MKITFKTNYTNFIIHNATNNDIDIVTRMNTYEVKQDHPIIFKEKPTDINFYQDDDVFITGIVDANHPAAIERVNQLKDESARYWKYYQDEKKELEALKLQLKELTEREKAKIEVTQ